MPFEPKYDVTMSEQYKIRMTAEQRRLIKDNFPLGAGTASQFWREYDVYSAQELKKLQAGEITAAEFGSNVANFVSNFMSATLPEQDEK